VSLNISLSQSTSFEVTPLSRICANPCSYPIVTMSMSRTSYRFWDKSNNRVTLYHFRDKARYLSKIATFSIPPLGGPRRNIAIMLGTETLHWCAYPTVKKFDDLFSRFNTIPACDRQHSPRRHHSSLFGRVAFLVFGLLWLRQISKQVSKWVSE